MSAYQSPSELVALQHAAIGQALRLIERNQIGEAQLVLHDVRDAGAECLRERAEAEAEFAEMMGGQLPMILMPVAP